jgi:hypothetical protein
VTVYSFCGYAGARLGSKSFYDVMTRPSLTPGPSTTYTCHARDRSNSTLSLLPNRLNLLRPKTQAIPWDFQYSYYMSNLSSTISHVLRPTLSLFRRVCKPPASPRFMKSARGADGGRRVDASGRRYLSRAYASSFPS